MTQRLSTHIMLGLRDLKGNVAFLKNLLIVFFLKFHILKTLSKLRRVQVTVVGGWGLRPRSSFVFLWVEI